MTDGSIVGQVQWLLSGEAGAAMWDFERDVGLTRAEGWDTEVSVGMYPVVTSQYSPTALYQIYYHIQ